jgi:hypothetical protein
MCLEDRGTDYPKTPRGLKSDRVQGSSRVLYCTQAGSVAVSIEIERERIPYSIIGLRVRQVKIKGAPSQENDSGPPSNI